MEKRAFKNIGNRLKYHKSDIIEIIIMFILSIVIFAVGFFSCFFIFKDIVKDELIYWENMTTAPEPEICSLCKNGEGSKCHAPCIINLSTGEIAEIKVYEPHSTEIGEVSRDLRVGHHSYNCAAGVNIARNQDLEKCEATLPKDLGTIDPTQFCYNCRRLLADIDREGYVLVDLYEPDNIAVYKIWNGAKYIIRDYLVTVHQNKDKRFVIEVHGLLNLTGSDKESY